VFRKAFTLFLKRRGLELKPVDSDASHPDREAAFEELYEQCAPFTMTTWERMYALWLAVGHVVDREIPGAIVECGVWRGGSSMLAALTLLQRDDGTRHMYLYDTFAGMSEPTDRDVNVYGLRASDDWASIAANRDDPVLAYASLDEVRANMARTGWPTERITYVEGKVEDTLPGAAPAQVALLRLDTDFYESTKHELEELWPRLAPGGVLIIDDYGDWAGARGAVDEFFASRPDAPLLSRVDSTGRIGVKPG
jgi:hypothetical protein